MPGAVRFAVPHPSTNPNSKVSVRGKVVEYVTMTKGRLFWKTLYYGILVRIPDDQHAKLDAIVREIPLAEGGTLKEIKQELQIWLKDETDQQSYAIGVELGLTFSYAGPLEQFFTAAEPCALIDVQRAPKEMPNEILPTQLELV